MIKKILAKNLFSYAELEFELVDGITGIDGFNYDDETSEGSGKSSLPNILCWTLFGQIPKDAKIDDVIKHGEKSAQGIVELQNGCQIHRSRKPNDLGIILDTGETLKGKDAKETQQMICDLLGFSYDTFVQAVYFAQNYPKKFITANEADKVKILSEILELDQFDRARKEVMALIKKEESGLSGIKAQAQQIETQIPSIESRIKQLEESKNTARNTQGAKIKAIKIQIQEKTSQLETLKSQKLPNSEEVKDLITELEKDLELLYKQIAQTENGYKDRDNAIKQEKSITRQMRDLDQQGDKLEAKLKKLRNPKDKKCPTCKTVLESLDSLHFQEEIACLEEEYKDIESKYYNLEKELATIKIPDVSAIEAKVKALNENIETLTKLRSEKQKQLQDAERKVDLQNFVKKEISQLQKRLEELESEDITSEFDKHLNAGKKELQAVSQKLKELKPILEKKEAYLLDLEVLKESYKEIKSYTFQNTLQELSFKANEYLKDLFTIPVELEFTNITDSGVAKILCNVLMDGIDRPLGLYSGGQSRRLQLAVDLALSDIIASRSNKVMNLRIFDEAMKDLSENSMNKVLELLSRFKGATLIIEHNTIFKSIMENIVQVELRNGTSTLCQ